MTGTIEARKAALIESARALASEMVEAAEPVTAARLVTEFFEHVPPADVAERGPRDLCGAALSLWRFAERRRPGQAKVRVYNPDPAADGWASPHTIVEVVNDDMPFLVDSVSLAINAGGRVTHLVIHPILNVVRDPKGRLRELRDVEAAGLRESWMQIEITRESVPDGLAQLTQTLSNVLADVRAAVEDWQPMRQGLRELLDELSRPPLPPVPPMELDEVEDFLRWLDDDNFTFLGYREYRFDGAAGPAREPLGILRDEAHPVFGGLRDLSSMPRDVQDFVRRRELLVITNRTAAPRFIARRTWTRSGCAALLLVEKWSGSTCSWGSSPRLLTAATRSQSRCCGSRFDGSSSAPGWRRRAMTARRCCTSSTRSRATSCSRPMKTSSSIPLSAFSTFRKGSESRCSSAATRSSALSPASSMHRANVTTPRCASASPRSSKRRSPGSSLISTPMSTSRRWRASSSLFAPPEAECRRSMAGYSRNASRRPDAAGWTASRRRRRRPLAKRRRVPG